MFLFLTIVEQCSNNKHIPSDKKYDYIKQNFSTRPFSIDLIGENSRF